MSLRDSIGCTEEDGIGGGGGGGGGPGVAEEIAPLCTSVKGADGLDTIGSDEGWTELSVGCCKKYSSKQVSWTGDDNISLVGVVDVHIPIECICERLGIDRDVGRLNSNASVSLLLSINEFNLNSSISSEHGTLISIGCTPDKHSSSKLKSNSCTSNI